MFTYPVKSSRRSFKVQIIYWCWLLFPCHRFTFLCLHHQMSFFSSYPSFPFPPGAGCSLKDSRTHCPSLSTGDGQGGSHDLNEEQTDDELFFWEVRMKPSWIDVCVSSILCSTRGWHTHTHTQVVLWDVVNSFISVWVVFISVSVWMMNMSVLVTNTFCTRCIDENIWTWSTVTGPRAWCGQLWHHRQVRSQVNLPVLSRKHTAKETLLLWLSGNTWCFLLHKDEALISQKSVWPWLMISARPPQTCWLPLHDVSSHWPAA